MGLTSGKHIVVDTESAFPVTSNGVMMSQGLTKREYFAAMAMQGILANRAYEPPRSKRLEGMAIDSVNAADALIGELEK